MKKLSKKEAIAVTISLLTVMVFIPAVFTPSNELGESVLSDADSNNQLHQAYFESVGDSILNFETIDISVGDGDKVEFGDTVYVHYVGMLPNGDIFDTSTRNSEPFKVLVGNGEVIIGWDLGLVGMREGGTRYLSIPPALAYGSNSLSDNKGNIIIPANATLWFDIVLLRVDKAGE